MSVKDHRGSRFEPGRYHRLVSLVPSITETLFSIGAGDRVAGRTRWCTRPAGAVRSLPVVGGTKDADVRQILALAPDLVIANEEENTRELVDVLVEQVPVFVTFPRRVADAVALCRTLGALLGAPGGEHLACAIDAAWQAARERRPNPSLRVATLVWWRPLMAAGPDTYLSDLLHEAGAKNALPARRARYPEISRDDLFAADLDVVLLPDEPFRFTERHVRTLDEAARAAGLGLTARVIPGHLATWFGARTRLALPRLSARLAEIRSELTRGRRARRKR